MFFKKKDQGPQLVGAREKIQKAQARAAGRDVISGKKEGKTDHTVLVVLIYILSVTLCFVLMMGRLKGGLDLSTGISGFDRIMFSGGTPSVMGSSDIDQFVVPALRGLVLFLLVGITPGLTYAYISFTGKTRANPYIVFWTVSLGVLLVVTTIVSAIKHL
jgi:hypothetical protein